MEELKYEKYKRKVKLWEKQFVLEKGRPPSKHDIRESKSICEAYKMYYKLKSSFLEDTLSQSLDDDGFDVSFDNTQMDSIPSSFSCFSDSGSSVTATSSLVSINMDMSEHSKMEFSNINQIKPISLTNLKNINENHIIREFEAESIEQINEQAWGTNVSNASVQRTSKENRQTSMRNIGKLVTDRLFKNSNFAKRNPRKSLSRSQSSSQSSLNLISPSEVLPDLETILTQKASQQQLSKDETVISPATSQPNQKPILNLDQGWLNRTTDIPTSQNLQESTSLNSNTTPKSFGISNLISKAILPTKEPSLEPKTSFGMSGLVITQYAPQSDDEIIENSDNEESTSRIGSLRHVLKKRKIDHGSRSSWQEPKSLQITQNIPKVINPIVEQAQLEMCINTVDVEPQKNPKKTKAIKYKNTKKSKLTKHPNEKENIRRSSRRTTTKQVKYSDRKSSSDEEAMCDFSDSDIDPTYEKPQFEKDSEEDTSIPPEKQKSSKNKKPVIKKSLKKIEKKSPKTTTSKRKKNDSENVYEDDQPAKIVDYNLEFGTDSAVNIPQIDIEELKKNTEMFEKFVENNETKRKPLNTNETSAETAKMDNTKRDKLEKKISAGKLNENFVRINIQKKVFVRGKKTVNYSRYKKKLWKKNKAAAPLTGPEMDMRGCDGGFLTCFECGQPGHFAQNCKIKSDRLLPLEADVEESDFVTLEEAEQMTKTETLRVHGSRPDSLPATDNPIWKNDAEEQEEEAALSKIKVPDEFSLEPIKKTFIGHAIPKDFLEKCGFHDQNFDDDQIGPLYNLTKDGKLIDTPKEVHEALKLFGHSDFRKGQDKAIMRVLSGLSTLVTLSTGSGKSLCYQLPAYLYRKKRKCITLVISPLVSLMEDQVHGVPHFLNAQCLHTNQSKIQREKTMKMIKSGSVDVLLISPEAVVAGEKSTGFGSLLRELPPIAFVCIDEAHCVSQWSHNFRPSYLMICRVLREKLKVKTVLGLTATATLPTRESIVQHLAIPDGLNGVISDIPLPDNLVLSVSKDENRDIALIELLREEKFMIFQSIIIYCTRRDECERIANKIRTCFQDVEFKLRKEEANTTNKRKRSKKIVESYHAGMAASRRKTIQNDFMRGNLKIVVATIAFGMGINKSDIRAVIHYNMPMTFEGYVQEVGRAGRDGEIAHCHLFLDKSGNDKTELRRHIFANSIDRHVIRKLLRKVFVPCACAHNLKNKDLEADVNAVCNMSWNDDFTPEPGTSNTQKLSCDQRKRKCPGHEVCFSVDDTIQLLDIPEENIATLLCYIELHEQRYIRVLSKAYRMCKVLSYGGTRGLKQAAKICAPLAMAIALDIKKGVDHNESSFIEFAVVDIASAIGWDSGVVKYQIKNLEWTTENGLPKRSNISVEFYDLGFRVKSPGDLNDKELDSALEFLHSRVVEQEKAQLIQLQNVYNGLSSVAFNSYRFVFDSNECEKRSDQIKQSIRAYFQSSKPTDLQEIEKDTNSTSDEQIITDIRTMIARYPENKFTGRALARIFHGVSSPVYPAQIWSRCNYWRGHTKTDFNQIVQLANQVIIKMRS